MMCRALSVAASQLLQHLELTVGLTNALAGTPTGAATIGTAIQIRASRRAGFSTTTRK
jgi:hypothetical protein